MRVFYDKGFEATKMRDVATEAQLGKGTLYLYFKTKDELILAIGVRKQRHVLKCFEAIDRAAGGIIQLRRMLQIYTREITTPGEHLKMVMGRWATATPLDMDTRGGTQMRENMQRIYHRICEAISCGQADGSIREDVAPAVLAMHIWGGVNGGLLMTLKMQCLPTDNPFTPHVPGIDEHIEFVLDAARTRHAQTAEPPLALASGDAE